MKSNEKKNIQIPNIQPVKFIQRSNGTIKGYAVNTYHGLVKKYNEDRVSIIMNITKPHHQGRWPRCSYFGIFDGHGGNTCSDFLKQNMHKYITQNQFFPSQPIQSLKFGFKKSQQEFIKYAESRDPIERSGSCAVVVLIIDQMCFIANVGDSRAILSTQLGKKTFALSKDHKPDSMSEKERIYAAGGGIYQSAIKLKNGGTMPGPFRITPGKLSVSRAFGDIEAKQQKFDGNPRVLIAKPEITYFQINPRQHDYIFMGSDGIFDKMANEEITDTVWNTYLKDNREMSNFGTAASNIIQKSMYKLSMDNLTSLLIVFEDNGRFNLMKKGKNKNESLMEIGQLKKSNSTVQINNENDEVKQNRLLNKIIQKRKSMTDNKLQIPTQKSMININNIPKKSTNANKIQKKQNLWKLLGQTKNKIQKIRY